MNGLRNRARNRRPIRVLHMFHELRHSGCESMMFTAYDCWIDQNVDCELVAVGETIGDFAPQLEQRGYRIHHLKPSRFALLSGFLLLLLKRRPDVVHIHTERASFWLALEARLFGKRVVQTVHTLFPFTGSLRTERRLQRRIARFFNVTFVAVGPSVAHHEQVRFGNTAEVIWNWVDLDNFAPANPEQRADARGSFGLAETDFVVTTVGNCWPLKNHGLVIGAMALDTTPDDVVYLHVGDDSVGVGCDERQHAAGQPNGSAIRFLGTRSDVAHVLHASDLLLMPSSYEGGALAVVEALATDTPVLVGDSPGLRDLNALSSDVRLVGLDPAEISNRIAEIRLLARDGTLDFQGRAIATHWFDPARGVARYAELYRNQPQGGPR